MSERSRLGLPAERRFAPGSASNRKGGRAMTKPFRRGFLSKAAAVPVPPGLVLPEGLREQEKRLRRDWQ